MFLRRDWPQDHRLVAVAEENPQAAMFWPFMLVALDDAGRCLASPRAVWAKAMPALSHLTVENVRTFIDAFVRQGLLLAYEVGGTEYLAVPPAEWWAEQSHVHAGRREAASALPAPPDASDYIRAQTRANARKRAQNRTEGATEGAETTAGEGVSDTRGGESDSPFHITRAAPSGRAYIDIPYTPYKALRLKTEKLDGVTPTRSAREDGAAGAARHPAPPPLSSAEMRAVWNVFDIHLGQARTRGERGRRAAAVRDLVEAGVPAEVVDVACRNWRRVMGSATCTETGIAGHVGRLTEGWQVRTGPVDAHGRISVAELVSRWEPVEGTADGQRSGTARGGQLSAGDGADADGATGAFRC